MSSNSPTPDPSGNPTQAQIQQVQTNIANIQKLNDYVYSEGSSSRLSNAFGKLSCSDNNDLGLTIGLGILEGAFAVLGGLPEEAAIKGVCTFISSFTPGILSEWTTSPPPDLAESFGSLAERLQGMSESLDTQLANYSTDIAGNWNQTFSYNGNSVALSDLATLNVPVETDPTFFPIVNSAIFAMDQWIWQTILEENFVITEFQGIGDFATWSGTENVPISCVEAYYNVNPAYFLKWYWGPIPQIGAGTNPDPPVIDGWCFTAWNVGTGVSSMFDRLPFFGDGAISVDACNYLFIDSAPGIIINPAGLFTREQVFTTFKIRAATHSSDPPPAPFGP